MKKNPQKAPTKQKAQPIKRTPKTKPSKKSTVYKIITEAYVKTNDLNFIKTVAKELVEWSINIPDALSIEQYCVENRIPYDTLESWGKRHPFLKEAVDMAKMAIGVRRENGYIKNKYNQKVSLTLHNYLDRCKEDDKWHIELKQQADEKTQRNNIQWALSKFPDSPLVPTQQEKEKDDKDAKES